MWREKARKRKTISKLHKNTPMYKHQQIWIIRKGLEKGPFASHATAIARGVAVTFLTLFFFSLLLSASPLYASVVFYPFHDVLF